MRYLGVDLGEKRTGLAVGSDTLGMAGPVGVIHATAPDDLLKQLCAAIEEQGARAVVIGLPLNMDGTEGPASQRARELGARLERMARVTVHYYDERLTSYAADGLMAGSGLTRGQKKAARDALAAKTLLEDFLRSIKPPTQNPADPD